MIKKKNNQIKKILINNKNNKTRIMIYNKMMNNLQYNQIKNKNHKILKNQKIIANLINKLLIKLSIIEAYFHI